MKIPLRLFFIAIAGLFGLALAPRSALEKGDLARQAIAATLESGDLVNRSPLSLRSGSEPAGAVKTWLPLVINQWPPTYIISGTVRLDEAGLAGVLVGIGDGYTTETDSHGAYHLTLPAGAYSITPTLSHYEFNPPTREVSLPPAHLAQDFSAIQIEPQVFSIAILNDNADGYEDANGFYISGDSLHNDWIGTASQIQAGWIFSQVQIPPGAQIESAAVGFHGFGTGTGETLLAGFAEDSAALFSSDGANRPSQRALTSANVTWTVDRPFAWSTFETPDLKPIVQEIVDRSGWSQGNRLGFWLGNPSSSGAAWSFIDIAAGAMDPFTYNSPAVILTVTFFPP